MTTPLKFDTMEFGRLDGGKARVVITGDHATVLEALSRSGNGLGRLPLSEDEKRQARVAEGLEPRPVIACPMEGDEHDYNC